MRKQIYQQFLVVVASARAKGQGDRPKGRAQRALASTTRNCGIFVYALIYLSITIKYLFLYLLHLFITSFVWLLSLSIFCLSSIYIIVYFMARSSFFVLRWLYFGGFTFRAYPLPTNPRPHANFWKIIKKKLLQPRE